MLCDAQTNREGWKRENPDFEKHLIKTMDIFKGGDGNMNDEANNVNRQQRNADNKLKQKTER